MRRRVIGVLVLALGVAACGGATATGGSSSSVATTATSVAPATSEATTTTAAPTTTAPPAETTTSTASAAAACDHAFMPIRQGSLWEYADADEVEVDWRITSVSPDGSEATMETEFASAEGLVEITVNLTCDATGVSAPELGMAGLPFGAEVTILQQEGVYLPPQADLVPGATWDTILEVSAEFPDAPGMTFEIVRETTYTVEGPEEVTVPAGKFTALRIRAESTIEILSGPVPTGTESEQLLWFAEGIGLVKETIDVNGIESFTHLTDYSIP